MPMKGPRVMYKPQTVTCTRELRSSPCTPTDPEMTKVDLLRPHTVLRKHCYCILPDAILQPVAPEGKLYPYVRVPSLIGHLVHLLLIPQIEPSMTPVPGLCRLALAATPKVGCSVVLLFGYSVKSSAPGVKPPQLLNNTASGL